DAQRPQPTWSSSKRGLEVVTGERLEIERLRSRSEEGRWKSTHRGNSLAAYPTASTVRGGGHATPEKVNGAYSTACRGGGWPGSCCTTCGRDGPTGATFAWHAQASVWLQAGPQGPSHIWLPRVEAWSQTPEVQRET